jgi:uncharacterized RDD family membrane protein YckC
MRAIAFRAAASVKGPPTRGSWRSGVNRTRAIVGLGTRGHDADHRTVKQSFDTSVGTVEVLVDEASRIVSIYRFDAGHRPMAASIESWDHSDLADVLMRQAAVPPREAHEIAGTVRARYAHLGPAADRVETGWERTRTRSVEHAGVALRFVAVLLDAIIVLFPLGIVVALLTGGGYKESGPGYVNAGLVLSEDALVALIVLAVAYYIMCEAITGATLGKHMVGIRVVDENGEHVSLGAAVVRNVLRVIDALFFYLVGALFALSSPLGQRLGDRAAHTVVVRR